MTFSQREAKSAFEYADIKISGITEESMDLGVVFCMYVNDGGEIYYLDGGTTGETVALKSYADISAIIK